MSKGKFIRSYRLVKRSSVNDGDLHASNNKLNDRLRSDNLLHNSITQDYSFCSEVGLKICISGTGGATDISLNPECEFERIIHTTLGVSVDSHLVGGTETS